MAETVLDFEAIKKAIPHRYPFLLIDRVTITDPDKSAVGIKSVSGEKRLGGDGHGWNDWAGSGSFTGAARKPARHLLIRPDGRHGLRGQVSATTLQDMSRCRPRSYE